MDLNHKKTAEPGHHVVRRIIICSGVLLVGIVGMIALAKMKKPPAEAERKERPTQVEVIRAQVEDVQVTITGFGEVRALTVVHIAPEVSGMIVGTHPLLEVGEIIPNGDILFEIDPRDYRAALQQAQATVSQLENAILRLKKQAVIDQQRLKTLSRSRELAKNEFERLKRLYERDKVGTRSGVDSAELAYNSAVNQAEQLYQIVSLYPIQIKETQSNLAAARAQLDLARANLERCRVSVPFNARVKEKYIEKGQYAAPGQQALTLVNDEVLEIHVPLNSRDTRDWLQFNGLRQADGKAWFAGLKPVTCTIRWTEDPQAHAWEGKLHRVVRFDQQTRTLTVAVRLQATEALSKDSRRLPLVEGMFCSVAIPGRTLKQVIRLPRWAVSFENTAYISNDGRLKTVDVNVARTEDEYVFVAGGISAGDLVVITRLVNPLENTLLDVKTVAAKDVWS